MACKGNINIVTKQKNNAGWSSLVARRAHKTHLKLVSLLDIISVIGIYKILNF